MSEDSPQQRMDAYLREQENQPFGNTELTSGQTLAPFSRAAWAGAENLLTKADQALAAGDHQRADSLIDRAVGLAYDRHERSAPAAMAASMMLFNEITDTLEVSAEDEAGWLDAAAEALAASDDWGRSELRHLLLSVRQDYNLEPGEARALDALVAEAPDRTELRDLPPKSPDLRPAVTAVLHTLQAYRAALATP